MVALDMDGTLLNKQHQLSDGSIEALRSLDERGMTIALCSGRSTIAMHDAAEKLGLSRTPIVSFNGAAGLIATPPGFNLAASELFTTPVPEATVDALLGVCERQGVLVQYYIGNDIYVACKSDQHVDLTRRYAALTGVAAHLYVDSYDEARQRGLPYKCLVLTDEVDEQLAMLREAMPAGAATLIRGSPPFFVEVLNCHVNKGVGLQRMCEALGLAAEAVVAFGDGDNDVEFVQAAGLGVAMCNARPTLKAVADRVTDRNNDADGVAYTLQQLESEGLLALPAPRKVRGLPHVTIRRVRADVVVGTRERVMWPGKPERCILPADRELHATHLAALVEGEAEGGEGAGEGGAGLPSSTVCGVVSLFLPPTEGSGRGTATGSGRAQFRKLAVEEPFRRQGVATALVETAAVEARLAGATCLWCDARAEQEGFYAARGFEASGEPFEKYEGGGLYVQMEMAL